jgi:hypothetical protein
MTPSPTQTTTPSPTQTTTPSPTESTGPVVDDVLKIIDTNDGQDTQLWGSAHNKNCYQGRGATIIGGKKTKTVPACKKHCEDTSSCDCITVNKHKGCWLRKNCNLARCASGGNTYSTYMMGGDSAGGTQVLGEQQTHMTGSDSNEVPVPLDANSLVVYVNNKCDSQPMIHSKEIFSDDAEMDAGVEFQVSRLPGKGCPHPIYFEVSSRLGSEFTTDKLRLDTSGRSTNKAQAGGNFCNMFCKNAAYHVHVQRKDEEGRWKDITINRESTQTMLQYCRASWGPPWKTWKKRPLTRRRYLGSQPCDVRFPEPVTTSALRLKIQGCGSKTEQTVGKTCSKNVNINRHSLKVRIQVFTRVGPFGWDQATKNAFLDVVDEHHLGADDIDEKGFSELICTDLLQNTCRIVNKFDAWVHPGDGDYYQDPDENHEEKIAVEVGNSTTTSTYYLIASKNTLQFIGEQSTLQKWMLCARKKKLQDERSEPKLRCCVHKFAADDGRPLSNRPKTLLRRVAARLRNF